MLAVACFHGAQDLYPDFLKSIPASCVAGSILGMKLSRSAITIVFNVGAIVGALFFGQLSQKMGRRNAIMLALGIALLSIPAWARVWDDRRGAGSGISPMQTGCRVRSG